MENNKFMDDFIYACSSFNLKNKNKNKIFIERWEKLLYIWLTNVHSKDIVSKSNNALYVNNLIQKYSNEKILGQYYKHIMNKQSKYDIWDSRIIHYAINCVYFWTGMYWVNKIANYITEYKDCKDNDKVKVEEIKEEVKEPVKEYKFNILWIKF